MRLVLTALFVVFATLGAFGWSKSSATKSIVAQTTWDYPPINCSSDLCVIRFSPGGIIDLFAAQGRQLAADKTPVIVDGVCLSACTVLVDLARANVCLTKNAILGYHKSFQASTGLVGEISYETPGLNAYLDSRGGLPDPTSGPMLLLNFNEARLFYPACRT